MIEDSIRRWKKSIKDHEKEMWQKWPDLFELLCG